MNFVEVVTNAQIASALILIALFLAYISFRLTYPQKSSPRSSK